MTVNRRDYVGRDDLRRMQSLVQRMWDPTQQFHVGDLAWGRFSIPDAEESLRASLWERAGDVVAWAWVELPGHLELVVHPEHRYLVSEMLRWFEATAAGPDLSCLVMGCETHVREALESQGYVAQPNGPYFTRHVHDLVALPTVALPDGFTIESVLESDAGRRAAAHRAGWSDFGSRLSTESYADIMRTYPYRLETDLVVVAPDGEWVASALGWYDELNRVGLVEPVSCRPEYRGMGLARAVNEALLYAFREFDATTSVVMPRGDESYPAPGRLYRSIGYQPGHRTIQYFRQRFD